MTMSVEHTCCWHQRPLVYLTYPPQTPEVCCHCGATRILRPTPPPPPPGHGPYFPQPAAFGWGTSAGTSFGCPCRVENGGSGVCNCTLNNPVTY